MSPLDYLEAIERIRTVVWILETALVIRFGSFKIVEAAPLFLYVGYKAIFFHEEGHRRMSQRV